MFKKAAWQKHLAVLANKRQDSKVFVHYDYTIFKKESKILTTYTK